MGHASLLLNECRNKSRKEGLGKHRDGLRYEEKNDYFEGILANVEKIISDQTCVLIKMTRVAIDSTLWIRKRNHLSSHAWLHQAEVVWAPGFVPSGLKDISRIVER